VFLRKKNGNLFSVSSILSFLSKCRFIIRKNFKLRLFLHCVGLSILGAALFLQSLVLSGILERGYFMGIEQNLAVLYSEIFLTALAITYLVYLFWRFVVSAI
jgi:hypothetical protein